MAHFSLCAIAWGYTWCHPPTVGHRTYFFSSLAQLRPLTSLETDQNKATALHKLYTQQSQHCSLYQICHHLLLTYPNAKSTSGGIGRCRCQTSCVLLSHQCCTVTVLPFRVTKGRPRGRADLPRDCTRPKPRTAAAPLPPEASGRSRRGAGWHLGVQRQPPFPCRKRGR